MHLPNNETHDEIRGLHAEFLRVIPDREPHVVMLGDYNVQFSWKESGDESVVPAVLSTKWAALRQQAAEVGLQQVCPSKRCVSVATFHSRKENVAKRQIDGAFVRDLQHGSLETQEGSRHEVSADHDRIQMRVFLGRRQQRARTRAGGVRVVATPVPPQTVVTQESLCALAATHTRPPRLGPISFNRVRLHECFSRWRNRETMQRAGKGIGSALGKRKMRGRGRGLTGHLRTGACARV